MTFHLISLGCQMNISDSERVRTTLISMGMEETAFEDTADIVGVMACSVRQKAIDKVYSLVHKWGKIKKKRSLITFISGCILPSDREKFLKKFDLLFSINELPSLPEMITQYGVSTAISSHAMTPTEITHETPRSPKKDSPMTRKTPSTTRMLTDDDIARGFWKIPPSYSSRFDAFVTIQNGCDKFCTFCAVPYTRGREVSRASSEILQEVYTLMNKGYKSITLLGQNVNSYGLDTASKELSFAQLLARIGNMAKELDHQCWVYFTSPHPRDMGVDVLEAMAQYPALAKQIHLPLQSGDDKLLMRMNRNHGMTKYRQVVQNIRTILPQATLFTDIIVGFCGETDAQFQKTVHAMKEFEYNMAYIAMYSPRPGAASYRWKDDIPLTEKKQRLHTLSRILRDTSQSYNNTLIGKDIPILVEKINRHKKQDSALLIGRTEGKIPTQITFSKAHAHLVSDTSFLDAVVGNFVTARVNAIHSLSLECELQVLPSTIETHRSKVSLHE